ncbi:MAG: hypothetical protein COV36_00550 [Alphaproteobacteria bacterium CG11_big_fil_rev_8_21_14_0_20_44_7]|nr:MAG: hypothetical protein COV36_00550 [Alphaproteobacteria bacterium CG11_big_fil_rev_8_21_14_0_20_44_7]
MTNPQKIYIENLPDIVASALSENLQNYELTDSPKKADFAIKAAALPTTPYKLGDIITCIEYVADTAIPIGRIICETRKQQLSQESKKAQLTGKEVELIKFLHQSPNSGKEKILQNVWGYSADTNTRTVETHIHRLNQKAQEAFAIKIVKSDDGKYKLIEF